MDRYSIFDHGASGQAAAPAPAREASFAEAAHQPVQPLPFPAQDNEPSLAAMADRDLDAALQLLAERALYVTGSSGATIALLDGPEMVCRASAGPTAPEVGSQLQLQAGLTGESVRLKKVLQCDDAERDLRVNRESCRALGVQSVMVSPLLRDGEVIGVFELLADRTHAFEDRDVTAVGRLTEVALTALEHADAAKRAFDEIASATEPEEKNAAPSPADAAKVDAANVSQIIQSAPTPVPSEVLAKIKPCEVCGFPVSEGRTLCVDCEQVRRSDSNSLPAPVADFLGALAPTQRKESWFDRHMYTLGTIIMVALTALALWLKFR